MDQTNSKYYEKGDSASNAGIAYQIKLLTIFLLRGLSQPIKFNLATEMKQEDVGKFDDIIFSWIQGDSAKESLLLQAKHLLKDTSKIALRTLTSTKDNEFSLVKYFHSYLENIKFNKELGNIKGLIVFTNKRIDHTVMEHVQEVSSLNFILKNSQEVTSGSFYKFSSSFMEQLRNKVIIYQCDRLAKRLANCLLYKENISFLQKDCLTRLQLSLLRYCFEFESSANMNRICGLNQEFINNHRNKNMFYEIFKKSLIDELKKKSKLFWEQMRKITSHNDNVLFNLHNLSSYLECYEIFVVGDMNVNYENFSKDIISMEDVNKFSELFILAVDQPNVHKLDDHIKDLLTQHPLFESLDVSGPARHLLSQVDEWFNQKTGLFLNEVASNKILMIIYLELMSSLCIGKNNLLGKLYSVESLNKFSGDILPLLENQKKIIHINSKCDCKFVIPKLHQVLLDKGKYFYLETSLMMDKMSKGIDLIDALLNVLSLTGVVFVCMNSNLNRYSLLLQAIQKIAEHCKVILISPENNDHSKDILSEACSPLQVQHIVFDTSIAELSKESLHAILARENVEFQGTMCSLLDVLNEKDIMKIIDMNGLSELIADDSIVIGDTFNCSLYNLSAAYSKVFHKISFDRLLSLLSCDQYAFVLSFCENSTIIKKELLDLHNLDKIIMFNHKNDDLLWNENQFHKASKNFLNKVVFWIEVKSNVLVLHQVYNPHFYLKRQFNCVAKVEIQMQNITKALSKDNTPYRFVIDKATNDQIQQLMNCRKEDLEKWVLDEKIIISQEENVTDIFNKVCSISDNVHWLELKDEKILWVKSHGPLDFIRKCDVKMVTYGEEHIASIKKSMVIISDDAGMGKSTTLTSLTHYITTNELKHWVVRINFNQTNVQSALKLLGQNRITIDSVTCFFYNIDNFNSVTKPLLRYYLELDNSVNNKLVIVLDGLDEVPPSIQKVVNDLLKFLHGHTTCTVFLATRQHYASTLEDSFSVFALSLQEISFDDQCSFLVNHWQNQITLISNEFTEEILHDTARKYLLKMQNVLKDSLRFLGIPLHLSLISDVSLPYVLKKELDNFLTDNSDVNMLFEQFIKSKFNIYFNEKNCINSSFHVEKLADCFHTFFTTFAFSFLFPQHFEKLNIDLNKEKDKYENDYLLIGLLYSKSRSSEWLFIHRTFCEYYCACFLMNCLQNKLNNVLHYQVAVNVIDKELFLPTKRDPFGMLKIFLDSKLCEDLPLCKSIFRNDTKLIILYMKTDNDQQDMLGRTALHIAAQYEDSKVVTFLLNCGFNVTDVDIFGRTPLHYACQRGHIENVKCLIAPYIDIDIHNNIFMKPLDKHRIPETVFENVVFRQSTLCEIINLKDKRGNACLSYAYKCFNFNLCSILIAHGSKTNFLSEHLRNIFLLELTLVLLNVDDALPAIALLVIQNSIFFISILDHIVYLLLHKFILYGYAHVVVHLLNLGYLDKFKIAHYNSEYPLFSFISIGRYLSFEEHIKIVAKLPKHQIYYKFLNCPQSSDKSLEYCLYYTAIWGDLESFKQLIKFSQEIICNQPSTLFQSLFHIFFHKEDKNCNFEDKILSSLLFAAIRSNRRNLVEFIWKHYRHVTNDKMNGISPLMYAAFCGDLYFVKLFCESGANVNCLNYFMTTPLHLAAKEKKLNVIKYLVSKNGNVNAIDSDCTTVLDCALTPQNLPEESLCDEEFSCIKYLVFNCNANMFADVNNSSKEDRKHIMEATRLTVNFTNDGTTLLHKAVHIGNEILVKYLLTLGAKTNTKDSNGRTPLDYSKCPSRISNLLFEYGARFEHHSKYLFSMDQSKHGHNLWNLFTSNTLYEDLHSLTSNSNLILSVKNATDCNGNLVHRAAIINDLKALCLLTECGKYNPINEYIHRNVPLNWLSHNDDGDSPVHVAGHYGNVEILKVLLKIGAKYNSKNNIGKTPVECCDYDTENGLQIIKILEMVKEFLENIVQNSLPRVEKMLLNCEFINVRDEIGRTALHWAVHFNYLEMVVLLMENGADKDATDDLKQTPLHYAATSGNIEIINHLLVNGCIFNCEDLNGRKPSDLYEKDDNILKEIEAFFSLLLKCEEDEIFRTIKSIEKNTLFVTALVNSCDVEGNTMLHHAYEQGYVNLVQFLFKHGAVYNKLNVSGHTPLKVPNCDLNCYFLFFYIDTLFNNYFSFSKYHNVDIECLAKVRHSNGDRLLHCTNDVSLVKCLMRHSKNHVDVKDAEGRTPLMRAIIKNNLLLVSVMLQNGADLNCRAKNGDTALHIAVRGGDLLMISYLVNIEGMKDMTVENHLGYTPVHIALSLDNEEVLNFLLSSSLM